MAITYCICGAPGTGKSTSIGQLPELGITGLDPKETAIINVMDKPLPFKGSRKLYGKRISDGGNYGATSNVNAILKALAALRDRQDIKHVIIDDWQYLLADELMRKANETGFQKFTQIAKNGYDSITFGRNLRDDQHFICLCHTNLDPNTRKARIKTVGKLLDEKIELDGLFTVVLHTHVRANETTGKMEYHFVTNCLEDENGILLNAKSPVGMFNDLLIPNDLGYVVQKATEFYMGE